MKKFNKNILVFVFAVIFLISGISIHYLSALKNSFFTMVSEITKGNMSGVTEFKQNVDDLSSKKLSYHDQLMDINSLKENITGTRIIDKSGSAVVKSDSGSLVNTGILNHKMDNTELDKVVNRITAFKKHAEKNGTNLLYCATPNKNYYEKLPPNIKEFSKHDTDKFVSKLKNKKVHTLNFADTFKEENIDYNDIYFYTDHHWKPYYGFVANKAICEELHKKYGFEYNKKYLDINNYNIKTYKDYFLGSSGKKTGTFFTWHGADDIDLITPKFKTDFTEEQPFKNQVRKGAFQDTVLYLENIEQKDLYNLNSYATYSGGDFRLQIMKNNLNPKGKKILLIKDSFACAVAPFLSLQTSELHIIDIRDYEYFVGDRINTYKYIEQIKPDYVLILYSGISSIKNSVRKYDFK